MVAAGIGCEGKVLFCDRTEEVLKDADRKCIDN